MDMTALRPEVKRYCTECGIVTRHRADGTCQECARTDATAIPLAEIETGRRERPVIILRPRA